jgi:DNA-binding CsgD family transcriptional regulator
MVWDEATARVIEGIYDSVDVEHGWMPFLKVVAENFDSSGANLFLRDETTGEFIEDCLYGPGAELQVEYERLVHTDPAWPISVKNLGALINDVDFYGDSLLESTAVYNEVLKPADAHYRVTSVLPIDDQTVAGFAVIRSKSLGSFEREHLDRLEAVVPHMTRALSLHRRLRALERDADNVVAALDRLPTAALIVSESLEIVCLNRQADDLLGSCETLGVRRGELVPERSSEASALRKAVGDAIALADSTLDAPLAPPQVVGVNRREKLPLEVLAVPLRPRYRLRQNTGQSARVMVMIYDPEFRPRIDPILLERLFDLTSTEAFVAARLAEGMSVAEVARERRCSTSTVRTHVKHIFQKTHTNRQGELVQLLLTSPAISFGG